MKDIKEQIIAINDYTDIRTVREIKERLRYINMLSPEGQKILQEAKKKGLV